MKRASETSVDTTRAAAGRDRARGSSLSERTIALGRRAAAAGLLALGATACGQDAPAVAERVRLLDLDSATLSEAPPPAGPERVFTADFSGPGAWRVLRSPGAARAPELTFPAEDGPPFARLAGELGALHLVLPAEPGRTYTLRGELRARVEPPLPRPFHGATFWIGEARDDRALEELLAGPEARLLKARFLPSPDPDGRWHRRETSFVSGDHTRFLHLLCVLSQDQPLAGAEVDFRALELEQGERAGFPRTALARAQARRAASEAPTGPWQRARQLGSELGGVFRPGFVLLPADRLHFRLPPREGEWRLRFHLGPWLEGRVDGLALASRLTITSATASFVHSVALGADETARADWLPFVLVLAEHEQELVFALDGDLPVAIGSPELARNAPRPTGPNVILVSIDTLRADHVGPRAGQGSLTPNLDRLAGAGLVAGDAAAVSPYTLPSHTTMLTGQLPSVHGVVAHESRLSAARSDTLAERLAAAGYVTRAFTAGGFVNPEFGLDRGFDAFTTVDPIRAPGSHFARTLSARLGAAEGARRLADQGFEGVQRFLADHADERFFLFLHSYTVHDYDAPAEYLPCQALDCARPEVPLRTRSAAEAAAFTSEMRAHVRHRYEAALRYTDERLGELLAELGRLGLAEETLVLVTSDHGEEFFEHGHLQHGMTLHEEILRVPLLLAGPGVPPRRLARPAMLCDVAPTLLARLGLAPLAHAQGVDLLGPDWPARPIWAEVDDRFVHQYALRSEDGAKTLHAPAERPRMHPRPKAWEHYELATDPHEARDLWPAPALEPRRVLLERERARLEALGASLGTAGSGELDEATEDELSGLGYGGG